MNLTRAELAAMLARNPQVTLNENQAQSPLQSAVFEPDQASALVSPKKRKTYSSPSVTVSFTFYRVRPFDPDNASASCKDLLDGLRHAGLIPGDSPFQIALQTRQIRVCKYREEHTEIEIIT